MDLKGDNACLPPLYRSRRALELPPAPAPPSSRPPSSIQAPSRSFRTSVSLSSNPSSSTPTSGPKTGAESVARGGSSETDGWGSRSGEGEETRRKPGWQSSPSLARSLGRGRAGGRRRPRPQSRQSRRPAGRRPRAREGASAGRERASGSGRAFFPGAPLGGSRGARSRSERGQAGRGGPGRGASVMGGALFGERAALGMEAPPDSEFISLVINSKLLYSENAVPLIEQAR